MTTTPPSFSGRGFGQFEPIPSEYGGSIQAAEASTAARPTVWLWAETPIDLNNPNGDRHHGSLLLTLENAEQLRDQLTWLIENHYQVKPR